VGVPIKLIKMVGSLEDDQEVLQDTLGVVSLENGVKTGASWEDLTGPPPVEVEDTTAAATEAVEREGKRTQQESKTRWP